ncbi:MAG: hypothetical protein PVG07_09940 [Acidobacteriota bacterium]
MADNIETKEVLLENLSPGEVASTLFEEYVTAGWRIVGQDVVAEKEGRMDVRVQLEREVAE